MRSLSSETTLRARCALGKERAFLFISNMFLGVLPQVGVISVDTGKVYEGLSLDGQLRNRSI